MSRILVKTRERVRANGTRWCVQLEFKAADAWVGAFWSTTKGPTGKWAVLDVWVCILPTLPIHMFANRVPVGVW